MKLNIRILLATILLCSFFVPTAQAQFVNFEDTWKAFLKENKTSNISKLAKPAKEEKEVYVKWCLMYANNFFCGGDIQKGEDLIKEIGQVGEDHYKIIPGFSERYDDLASKIEAARAADGLWLNFLKYKNVTLDDLSKIKKALRVCEKGTLAKYSYMMTYAHYCDGNLEKAKDGFNNYLLKIVDKTSLKIEDVEGLKDEVASMRKLFKGLELLEKSWAEFVKTEESEGFDYEMPTMQCNTIPTMKVFILRAAVDICHTGQDYLERINLLKKDNVHPIPADLKEKITWLETEVGKYNGDLATLDKAWKEFVKTNNLKNGITFGYNYCDQIARIKAFTMTGMLAQCDKSQAMLDSVNLIRKTFNPTPPKTVKTKVDALAAKLQQYQTDIENLDKLWATFIDNKDTMLAPFTVEEFYCDHITKVKSLVLLGHIDYCEKGQGYLDKIDTLQAQHELKYDEELACRILRLRIKVWDCRYWELVLQARKETHEERERFGPESARIMETDLNSEQQPCPTTVEYKAVKFIGVKYIISTYLCQDIDLAKMGDPAYYQKIATWVDTEVLQKYCESSTMRCKEEFFIYLEGHADGNRFRGARYKQSLDIPMGTTYTHFVDNEIKNASTERTIEKSLKNNKELALARAWTVKQQLDFMNVPIFLGAAENEEKGGDYRKVRIELNIPNLLLDFYEKRLKELWEASGIGERPEEC